MKYPPIRSRLLIPCLTLLVAVGPVATDMYLPSFPSIARELAAGETAVQATLSLYLLAFAAAQLILGPLSDRIGRRPVILGGMAVFAVGSLACALAPTIDALIAARVVQASGAAAGPVLARALVRDLWDEGPAARLLGLIGGIMAVAPAVAPIAGGLLDIRFGWTASFWTLCVLGVAAAGFAAAVLPETVTAGGGRQGCGPLADLRMLLGDAGFARQIGGLGLLYGGMLAYVSVAPFVLIRDMGLRADLFGVSYTVMVAGYVLGSLAVARRPRSTGDLRLYQLGGSLVAAAGPVLAAVLAGGAPAGAAVAAMAVYMSGFGILVPLVTARAIGRRPGAYGSAAALLGASEMAVAALCGAVATALLGVMGAQAMALVTTLCGFAAVFLLLPTPRPEASGGWTGRGRSAAGGGPVRVAS